jgi:uncharacterized protein YndB with AHSA1/START domain
MEQEPRMSKRSAMPATFVIERTYAAAPARVFHAWADPAAKAQWFSCHDDWTSVAHELDFRVGGREMNRVVPSGGGPIHAYDAHYHDIVPNERIIYTYDMHLGETRISVSLATVELFPAGRGTRLVFTEQVVFLDGYDDRGSREQGTEEALDKLGATLEREPAEAR